MVGNRGGVRTIGAEEWREAQSQGQVDGSRRVLQPVHVPAGPLPVRHRRVRPRLDEPAVRVEEIEEKQDTPLGQGTVES